MRAEIITGYPCNLNCEFCMAKRNGVFSRQRIQSALISLRKRGFDEVVFSGGEPSIRASLQDLITVAKGLGFPVIKVQTNALMYADWKILKNVVSAGMTHIGITVSQMPGRMYDDAVRVNGASEFLKAALRNISRTGLKTEADIVLYSGNQGVLEDVISWIASRGIRKINIKFLSTGGKESLDALVPETGPAVGMIKGAIDRFRKRLAISVQYVPYCWMAGYEEHVYDLEKNDITVVEGENEFSLRKSMLKDNDGCAGCRYRKACFGPAFTGIGLLEGGVDP